MLFDYNRLRKEQKEKILGKWKPFLKGLDDDYLRESTAMLLENEAQYLMEAPSTQATDVVGIQKILLPIVRRVFPNLVANNLVSVQPLAGPTGVIFWLKYVFATNKSGTTSGSEYSAYAENPSDTAQGYNPYYSTDMVDIPASQIGAGLSSPTGGSGSAPTFVFTTQPYNAIVSPTGASVPYTSYVDGLIGSSWTDATNPLLKRLVYRFTSAVTATPTTFSTWLIMYDGRAGKNFWQIKETDRGGAGVALFGSAANAVFGVLSAASGGYSSLDGSLSSGAATYTDASPTTSGSFTISPIGATTCTYGSALTLTAVEALYAYKQEGTLAIPDMKISISQYPITVGSRKLKATWTNEAEQDLKAYHGLNADAELTALVSNEMIAEIDREIVKKCMDAVPISSFRFLDWNSDVANNTTGNYLDRNRNLVQVLVELSNEIYRKSKIGPANWIITSPKVASYLEVLEGFIAAPAATQGGLGIVKAGDFRGAFAVYKDPLFPTNKILLGHKSPASPFGAGVVYAPYVTQVTPTLYGQDDFTPRKGFIARYGLIQVPLGDLLYAMVSISDLPGAV